MRFVHRKNVAVSVRMSRVIAAAVLAAVALMAALGTALVRAGAAPAAIPPGTQVYTLLAASFAFIALASSIASFPLRRFALAAPPDRAASFIVVAVAMAETPAVLGLAFALITGSLLLPAFLWAASFLCILLHMPGRFEFPADDSQTTHPTREDLP